MTLEASVAGIVIDSGRHASPFVSLLTMHRPEKEAFSTAPQDRPSRKKLTEAAFATPTARRCWQRRAEGWRPGCPLFILRAWGFSRAVPFPAKALNHLALRGDHLRTPTAPACLRRHNQHSRHRPAAGLPRSGSRGGPRFILEASRQRRLSGPAAGGTARGAASGSSCGTSIFRLSRRHRRTVEADLAEGAREPHDAGIGSRQEVG